MKMPSILKKFPLNFGPKSSRFHAAIQVLTSLTAGARTMVKGVWGGCEKKVESGAPSRSGTDRAFATALPEV
jgi:hypothetical protein